MAEVGVHDDDKVPCSVLQAVDVGGAEAEFASARFEEDAWSGGGGVVEGDQLLGDFLRAIWGGIVDYDKFPVELAAGWVLDVVRYEGVCCVCTALQRSGLEAM